MAPNLIDIVDNYVIQYVVAKRTLEFWHDNFEGILQNSTVLPKTFKCKM